MSGNDRPPASSEYRAARIGAAAALVAVLVFLLMFDAFSTDYQLDAVVLTSLLATTATLLGIEARSLWRSK